MPKQELGSTMYLITKAANTYSPILVISAHGGIDQKKEPQFTVPFGTLHFYSVHGKVTDDLGIRNFIFGGRATQRSESIGTGRLSYDYSLSKYQGKHGGSPGKPAETYESIEDAQNYVDQFNELLLQAGDKAPKGAQPAVDFDVLTVRNRWWNTDVTLSSALRAVQKVNKYQDIHCYFCRSYM